MPAATGAVELITVNGLPLIRRGQLNPRVVCLLEGTSLDDRRLQSGCRGGRLVRPYPVLQAAALEVLPRSGEGLSAREIAVRLDRLNSNGKVPEKIYHSLRRLVEHGWARYEERAGPRGTVARYYYSAEAHPLGQGLA